MRSSAMASHAPSVTVTAESRRLQLLDALADRLKVLDPIMGALSGIQITVRFYANSRRVIVIEPELRDEST